MGHARTLLALEGESQSQAALQIVEKGLSVRETEQLIRRLLKPSTADKQEVPQPSLEEIERIEQRIADKLGKGFSIKHRPNGKGKLVFDYSNVDELKRLIKQIGV